MYADYHLHTYYSDDSDYPMEQLVRDAIQLGLSELCFTDHVDYGVKKDWDNPLIPYRPKKKTTDRIMQNVNYPAYHEEIKRLKQLYKGRITLREGMEFGIQTHTIPQFQKLYSSYPFDFIIMSCHQVDDKEFWTQEFQAGKSQKEYNQSYYEEILHVIQNYKDYSVLGHLDMISRYDLAGVYPFEKIKEIVAEILKQAIRDDKGIEVNTSCYRYGLNDLTPSRKILKLYQDLGGKILTIGSDTHNPEHLAARIKDTQLKLKEMGFSEICTFENMQPIFHPIS